MFVVAQISDLHFNGTRYNRARIESALNYLGSRADGISALLITGDIADEGALDEYREALGVLASPLPILMTIGNHDNRENYNEVLRGARSDDPVNTALLVDGVLLLVVDSSIPGRSDGYLSDHTLAFMESQIDAAPPGTPVIVAFHHPPVDLMMPFMDTIRQSGEQRLADFVSRHPSIVGLVCGHAHSACVTRFAERPLVVAPGVSSTLNLPFEGNDIVNRGQPPGIAFHILDGDRLVTHFRSVMF